LALGGHVVHGLRPLRATHMAPAILFMIMAAFAVFCLIDARRTIWDFEISSWRFSLSETPPLKWRISLALLDLMVAAFMALTAYVLLGDTLLGP